MSPQYFWVNLNNIFHKKPQFLYTNNTNFTPFFEKIFFKNYQEVGMQLSNFKLCRIQNHISKEEQHFFLKKLLHNCKQKKTISDLHIFFRIFSKFSKIGPKNVIFFVDSVVKFSSEKQGVKKHRVQAFFKFSEVAQLYTNFSFFQNKLLSPIILIQLKMENKIFFQ